MTYKHEIGYYGNIWVKSNYLAKAGDTNRGHYHNFDHVTLLARGRVRVDVVGTDNFNIFEAPTFIVIDRDAEHKFTALTDDCIWYCVFAMPDTDQTGPVFGSQHSPFKFQRVVQDLGQVRRTAAEIAAQQVGTASVYTETASVLEEKTVKTDIDS